ncbi:Protein-Glutamine Gamma-Glutamyltransferase 5 [Manis pentadactyla]|nr:Protein-Glutamine Gamma-Glutamyltransferase 5 [Manis pentadactyla]
MGSSAAVGSVMQKRSTQVIRHCCGVFADCSVVHISPEASSQAASQIFSSRRFEAAPKDLFITFKKKTLKPIKKDHFITFTTSQCLSSHHHQQSLQLSDDTPLLTLRGPELEELTGLLESNFLFEGNQKIFTRALQPSHQLTAM